MKNNEIPHELEVLLNEVAGVKIQITNTSLSRDIVFGTVTRQYSNEEMLEPKENLEYIIKLITNGFFYRSILMPFIPQYFIGREDLANPCIWNQMIKTLECDFLQRIHAIPRGNFEPSDILKIISEDFMDYLPKDDRRKVDAEKLLTLTLFIYDYVQVSFNEMALNQHIKVLQNSSSIEINGERVSSNGLIDDLLMEYISTSRKLSKLYFTDKDGVARQAFNEDNLYVPNELRTEKHPMCNVNNMTAMFYDMFKKFFASMNLTKRSTATISEREKSLIAKLAKACKICNTESVTSVARMYNSHKDYFIKCELHAYIRENYYARLMLNNNENEMFQLVTPLKIQNPKINS